MIAELQNPAFMRGKIDVLHGYARDMGSGIADFGNLQFSDEPTVRLDDSDVAELVGSLEALRYDEALYRDGEYWMPHNAYAALLQANIDTYYRANDAVTSNDSRFGENLREDPLTPEHVLREFRLPALKKLFGLVRSRLHLDIRKDLRWNLVLQAKAIKLRKGRPPFPNNSARTTGFAPKARIVLVGDWASGIPDAVTVAKTIWNRHLQPELGRRELHVIHLGDAYYAGMPTDYKHRFLPQWPVPLGCQNQVGSWTLAGNHDMYSGGYGFFALLKDPRFSAQHESSYFLLQNDHWQVFGLDSSFDPRDYKGNIGELYGEQAAWVAQNRDSGGARKCLLLTHHQPFCAYSVIAEHLSRRLLPVLDAHQINSWFWGHEHLCAVFEPHKNIQYPVLLGHGGFPQQLKAKLPGAPPMKFEWLHQGPSNDVLLGFAVLDFDGPRIDVQLVDQNGVERHRFDIT